MWIGVMRVRLRLLYVRMRLVYSCLIMLNVEFRLFIVCDVQWRELIEESLFDADEMVL